MTRQCEHGLFDCTPCEARGSDECPYYQPQTRARGTTTRQPSIAWEVMGGLLFMFAFVALALCEVAALALL